MSWFTRKSKKKAEEAPSAAAPQAAAQAAPAQPAPSPLKRSKKGVAPVEEGFCFESARILMAEKSERRAWACARGLGVVTVLLAGTICLMMPLKKTLPFVVEVDRNTGMSEVLEISNRRSIPVSELMDKFWLTQYVRARESYEYHTVDADFVKVRELSLPEVFEPYKRQFLGDNSLDKKMGPAKGFRVELMSVLPTGNGIAQVRFIKRLVNEGTMAVEKESYWTATIGYDYFPSYTADERRLLVNPFGFKIKSYRLDQEFNRAGLALNPSVPSADEKPLTQQP